MALFHPLFTLGTLKTATIFLDPNTCFAEDIWPAQKMQCVHDININKLLMTFMDTN